MLWDVLRLIGSIGHQLNMEPMHRIWHTSYVFVNLNAKDTILVGLLIIQKLKLEK